MRELQKFLAVVLAASLAMNVNFAFQLNLADQRMQNAMRERQKAEDKHKAFEDEVDRMFKDHSAKTDKIIAGYQKLLVEQVERANRKSLHD